MRIWAQRNALQDARDELVRALAGGTPTPMAADADAPARAQAARDAAGARRRLLTQQGVERDQAALDSAVDEAITVAAAAVKNAADAKAASDAAQDDTALAAAAAAAETEAAAARSALATAQLAAAPPESEPEPAPGTPPAGGGGGGGTGSGPDPAVLVKLKEYADLKRAANDRFFRILAWVLWAALLLGVPVAIWQIVDKRSESPAARRVHAATSALHGLLDDGQGQLGPTPRPVPTTTATPTATPPAAAGSATSTPALAGPGTPTPTAVPSPSPSPLAAEPLLELRDLAHEIDVHTQRLVTQAALLPESWHGERMAIERRRVITHSDAARKASQALSAAVVADSPPAGPVQQALVTLRTERDAIAAQGLNPGQAWPWNLGDPVAQGLISALTFTSLLLGGLGLLLSRSDGLRRFFIGPDGRLSTAQTQAALWTVLIVFLLSHLLFRPTPGKFDHLDETYLLLLGGPYAAWVISGAVTRGKVDEATVQKLDAVAPQVRDLVTDGDGRASLVHAQFFAFSMIALVGVVIAFAADPSQLPMIAPGLALLTGAGALAYLGKKVTEVNAPVLLSAYATTPGPIAVGTELMLRGVNFTPPGAASDFDVIADANTAGVTVRFVDATGKVVDLIVLPAVDPSTNANNSKPADARTAASNVSNEQIRVVVPPLPIGTCMLSVIVRGSGVQTNQIPLVIGEAMVLTTVDGVGTPGRIRIVGSGLAPRGDRSLTHVSVGTSSSHAHLTWVNDTEVFAEVAEGTRGEVAVIVTNELTGTAQATAFVKAPPAP